MEVQRTDYTLDEMCGVLAVSEVAIAHGSKEARQIARG